MICFRADKEKYEVENEKQKSQNGKIKNEKQKGQRADGESRGGHTIAAQTAEAPVAAPQTVKKNGGQISPKPSVLDTIRAAFPHTVPVMTGYLFMGMAFGILLQSKGYGPLWAFCMALFIFAGSMQFVAVGLMAAGFHPVIALLMTLMVNARHVFYGISMLETFRRFGKAKYYMIFGLTDETFALFCSVKPPPGMNEERFFLSIAALDQSYWVAGCTLGGLLGTALPINVLGIDFVMTALFVVIFLEQWKQKQNRTPALIGLGVSILCRVVFGPQWFILAAMAVLVLVFSLAKKPLERQVAPK